MYAEIRYFLLLLLLLLPLIYFQYIRFTLNSVAYLFRAYGIVRARCW